jgi:fructose-1,6-bisphosphatase I
MMVYTTGQGVHGFTLDPTIGEFVLSHPNIRIPETGKYYSVNESHFAQWPRAMQRAVRGFHGDFPDRLEGKNSRYIGALVADFHRSLISGGIFLYPGEVGRPAGKLRLCYEASPLAMVAENAGGAATNGVERILDLQPQHLHQRTPLVIGSRSDVEYVSAVLAEGDAPPVGTRRASDRNG